MGQVKSTACATAGAAIGTTEGTTDLGSNRLGPVMPSANTTATTIAIIASPTATSGISMSTVLCPCQVMPGAAPACLRAKSQNPRTTHLKR